ncbi:hypothetical protein PG984_005412 [Apiospora sp. TS-2023a]
MLDIPRPLSTNDHRNGLIGVSSVPLLLRSRFLVVEVKGQILFPNGLELGQFHSFTEHVNPTTIEEEDTRFDLSGSGKASDVATRDFLHGSNARHGVNQQQFLLVA